MSNFKKGNFPKSLCEDCKNLPEGQVIKGHDHRRPDILDEVYERYSFWHQEFNTDTMWLKGRLLTLSDASFSDPQQRKAFKDLVSQIVDEFFRERIRSNIICTLNEVCDILVGEKLFSDKEAHRIPISKL